MEQNKPLNAKIPFFMKLKRWSFMLKSDIFALFNAFRHPMTPWYAKTMAILVVGYALSPIDLIPDFIPILGYLDDILLLPLLITLTIKLIPGDVMAECRLQAKTTKSKLKKILWAASGIIIFIWLIIIGGVWYLFFY